MTDTETRATSSNNEPGLWASPRMVGSAALIILVVLVGIVLVVLGSTGDDPAPPQVVASSTPSAVAPARAADPSICGLKDVQLAGTVATAPATTWALVGTVAAPSVEGAGPGISEPSGFRSCYSHTPTGALLAASNYIAVTSHAGSRRAALERLLVPGPGRDRALASSDPKGAESSARVQVAGFRTVTYAGGLATVDVAFRLVNGDASSYVSQIVDLMWMDGDWKIRTSDDANFLTPARPIPDLGGYVPWSGV